jgi:diacylglycerol diphosphate phosphatase/phosphatidate phosphatase
MAQSKGKGRATNGLTSKPGVIGAVARFWQKTYAPDYVGLAVLIAAYIVV